MHCRVCSVFAFEEILPFDVQRNHGHGLFWIDTTRGFLHHVGRYVGTQNGVGHASRWVLFEELANHHGNGVGLLATGAGRTPYLNFSLTLGFELGQGFVLQEVEVNGFAEEVGLVCCDHTQEVEQLLALTLGAKELLLILGVRLHLKLPNAL